jgi:DNA-binding response OmpR family regulator
MKQATTHPARILIVDDEPNMVVAIQVLMQQRGFETETAADGHEAMAKALAFRPDLVLLDVMMPKADGFEVAHAIRQAPTLVGTKVVFLTARGTSRDKLRGYDAGGDVYLTKPFDHEDLVNLITEMMEFERSDPQQVSASRRHRDPDSIRVPGPGQHEG